jgi:hypothetical protein
MIIKEIGAPKSDMGFFLDSDRKGVGVPNSVYKVDRGILDVWKLCYTQLDIFDHIRGLIVKNEKRIPRVLEGGCGIGKLLEDLKRGVQVPSPISEVDPRSRATVQEWKAGLAGQNFPGYEHIHTTGVTLSRSHADIAESTDVRYRVDEMLIGPIDCHPDGEPYDFVIDFNGPARYYPTEAIRTYGRLLERGEYGFIRLNLAEISRWKVSQQLREARLSLLATGELKNNNKAVNKFIDVFVAKK